MSHKLNITAVVLLSTGLLLFNSCKNYNIASRYDARYIAANNGKVTAQVSETYELGYTMLALTTLAQNDTAIINKNNAYYHEVMAWFGKYKNNKGVMQLNADLNHNPKLIKSYLDGLYAFEIKHGRFGLKDHYRIDLNKMDFKRYGMLLEHFYKETKFHDFYTRHAALYAGMIQKANSSLTFDGMSKAFSKTGSYQVILSPLTKGYAGNIEVKGRSFNEKLVFPQVFINGSLITIDYNTNK